MNIHCYSDEIVAKIHTCHKFKKKVHKFSFSEKIYLNMFYFLFKIIEVQLFF